MERIYGVAGDSLNGITDSIRGREQIRWIGVRHEEAAAFAAGAEAHLTGKLAVCAGSCGPGNLTRQFLKGSPMRSLTAEQVKLGFIGMGAMGSRLAGRLRHYGYAVAVYDRNPAKAQALLADDIAVFPRLGELAANSDVILSCLTDDDAVRSVYLSPEGVLARARPGTVLLEMSTVSPQTSRDLYALARERGLPMMDIAISGSTPAVESGSLTLLAGGDADLFAAAEPILRTLATNYFLLGPAGSGTSMKMVVNTILGIGMQAIAEAIALGEAVGLDRHRLLYVLSQTAVVAPALRGKLTKAETGDYSPQFPVRLMNKDFRLVLEAANSANLSLLATAAALEVNLAAMQEDPNADFSLVIRQMENTTDPHKPRDSDSVISSR